jgi:hypothetical protein
MVSPCDVWAAGYGGGSDSLGPLIERWTGGGNWTVVPTPVSRGGLESVAAVSPTSIWAVGWFSDGSQHGLILHGDGSSWTQVAAPGNSKELSAVAAAPDGEVWAAGSDTSGHAYLAHYDGTSWTQSLSPIAGGASINSLTATSGSDAWAVGIFQPGQTHPLILHWDGSGWNQVLAPDPPQPPVSPPPSGSYTTFLYSVSASSPSDAWAVGSVGGLTTVTLHWDGHSWTQVPSPNPVDPGGSSLNGLNSVVAVSANRAFAVGGSYNAASNDYHTVLLRWDGGPNWTQLPSPVGAVQSFGPTAAGFLGGILWMSTEQRIPQPVVAELGTVPNVIGDSQAAATDAMDSAGLHATITPVTTAGGGCGPATNGTIIATTPAAGTFTAPPVHMTFCDFPPVVTVPKVTGLNDDQAQGTLANARLTTGTITLSGTCSFDPGTVIRQSPAAGTTASRGTAVNLPEATPPTPHGCAQ